MAATSGNSGIGSTVWTPGSPSRRRSSARARRASSRRSSASPRRRGDVPGANECVAVAAALLPDGATVERPACSSPDHAPDLLARIQGTGTGRVLLLGHVDTVHAHAAHQPLRREDGKLFGCGTVDMKGGDVLALGVLRALAQRPDLYAEVALLLVCDEEWRTAPFQHGPSFAGWDACLCFEAGETNERRRGRRRRPPQGRRHAARDRARPRVALRLGARRRAQRPARARRRRPARQASTTTRRASTASPPSPPSSTPARPSTSSRATASSTATCARTTRSAFDAVCRAVPDELDDVRLESHAAARLARDGRAASRPRRCSSAAATSLGRPIHGARARGRVRRQPLRAAHPGHDRRARPARRRRPQPRRVRPRAVPAGAGAGRARRDAGRAQPAIAMSSVGRRSTSSSGDGPEPDGGDAALLEVHARAREVVDDLREVGLVPDDQHVALVRGGQRPRRRPTSKPRATSRDLGDLDAERLAGQPRGVERADLGRRVARLELHPGPRQRLAGGARLVLALAASARGRRRRARDPCGTASPCRSSQRKRPIAAAH